VRDGQVYVRAPVLARDEIAVTMASLFPQAAAQPAEARPLAANEFRVADLKPGQIKLLSVNGAAVAVYNVDGAFYATQDECPHADGPLSEGELDGPMVVCPWHASCFDVTSGAVLTGPAKEPLRTYKVTVEGEIARVQ
jgi:nitrite reductase/ring-hydroxylating ferredoxin subunit